MKKDRLDNKSFNEVGKIVADITEKSREYFEKQLKNFDPKFNIEQLTGMGELYQEFLRKMSQDPQKLISAQLSYWQDFSQLWQSSVLKWFGDNTQPFDKYKNKSERRFAAEEWEKNPLFNFYKEFYLLTGKHIQSFVNSIEGLPPQAQKKIDFYTRQFIDAISPSNFLLTNPQVLKKTIQTGGRNLLKGLDNMLSDLERGSGYLNINMTDLKAFAVGKNLAVTPGKVIYQNKMMQLIQYEPVTEKVHEKPLLMIPAWINKYYILDLSPEDSIVKWMVEQGYTVFMISWVNPDKKYAEIDFADYLSMGVLAALDAIEKATGQKEVNALGYCLGGTLLACALAYLAAKKEQRIVSATYLATLLDFSEPGDLGVFIDEKQLKIIHQQMQKKGFLDGGELSLAFNLIRANDLIWSFFIKNYLEGEQPFPLDFLYWNSDVTNLPAKMHYFYLDKMYLHNLLTKPGALQLNGVAIDLSQIKIPNYFLAAHHDHIAPWKSVYQGMRLQAGDTCFVLGEAGHVAGIANPPFKNKYAYHTNPQAELDPEAWLAQATEHPGSWCAHWEKWLRSYSGSEVAARVPGSGGLTIIEDAPGSYVQVKLKDVI